MWPAKQCDIINQSLGKYALFLETPQIKVFIPFTELFTFIILK